MNSITFVEFYFSLELYHIKKLFWVFDFPLKTHPTPYKSLCLSTALI